MRVSFAKFVGDKQRCNLGITRIPVDVGSCARKCADATLLFVEIR
jgi:hypothetical protein